MARSLISLGGNQGPVAEHFGAALQRIQENSACRVVRQSTHYVTEPVGSQSGVPFLNAAAEIETALSPLELLDVLQSIEFELGRRRTIHWGPRPIDLDLLFYEQEVIVSERLLLPHPAAWYRRFVLDPVVEIAPDFVHPVKGVSLADLRQRLLVRPLEVAFAGGEEPFRDHLVRSVSSRFPQTRTWSWDKSRPSDQEPSLLFWLGKSDTFDVAESPPGVAFEDLPMVPRIDASPYGASTEEFVLLVVQAATGC
jgi:2-amino-4-hydroxy-6-hydroxymethyldihydropteridine diphosphokinase